MSYCRWSSDDWKSDLYVYADVAGGYTAHVAGRRRDFTPPEPEAELWADLGKVSTEEWNARNRAYNEALKESLWIALPEPSTGSLFNVDTPGEMAAKLKTLRNEGFYIPDYAIEDLEAEQAELDGSGN